MKGWAFVRSRRWLGYLAFVVVFAIACVFLAEWQFARRTEAVAASNKIVVNYDSAPVPLESALSDLDSFSPSQEWKPVTLEGRYLAEAQLLVRTRALQGNPGFEVLVPFELESGKVFIIDRGWVPIGTEQDTPDSVPSPPAGTVTVVARLKPGEARVPGRSAPEGQIATIELDDIAAMLERPSYTAAYGLMVSENPPPAERPQALPKPAIDEGPHFSYAFQWIVFGLLALVALGWAVRQEYRILNANEPAERERARARERRRQAREPSDAEIEDSIIDDQLAKRAK